MMQMVQTVVPTAIALTTGYGLFQAVHLLWRNRRPTGSQQGSVDAINSVEIDHFGSFDATLVEGHCAAEASCEGLAGSLEQVTQAIENVTLDS